MIRRCFVIACLFALAGGGAVAQDNQPGRSPERNSNGTSSDVTHDHSEEFDGRAISPIPVTFSDPLIFTGRPQRPVTVVFESSLAFTGKRPNDLSLLEDMLEEVNVIDHMLESWVSHGHLAEDLIGQSDNEEEYRSAAFQPWLATSLRGSFYTLNQEVILHDRNARHLTALRAAIRDLEYETNQAHLRESFAHFESGMAAWRSRYADIRQRYYHCLVEGMFAAWQLDVEANQIWTSSSYDRAAYQEVYGNMQSTLQAAYGCTSRESLNALTAEPAFTWPIAVSPTNTEPNESGVCSRNDRPATETTDAVRSRGNTIMQEEQQVRDEHIARIRSLNQLNEFDREVMAMMVDLDAVSMSRIFRHALGIENSSAIIGEHRSFQARREEILGEMERINDQIQALRNGAHPREHLDLIDDTGEENEFFDDDEFLDTERERLRESVRRAARMNGSILDEPVGIRADTPVDLNAFRRQIIEEGTGRLASLRDEFASEFRDIDNAESEDGNHRSYAERLVNEGQCTE